jgi:hypothetical protein
MLKESIFALKEEIRKDDEGFEAGIKEKRV